jgi:hypothetical protein
MGHNFLPAILSPVSYLPDPTSRSAFSPAPLSRRLCFLTRDLFTCYLFTCYLFTRPPLYQSTSYPFTSCRSSLARPTSLPPISSPAHLFARPSSVSLLCTLPAPSSRLYAWSHRLVIDPVAGCAPAADFLPSVNIPKIIPKKFGLFTLLSKFVLLIFYYGNPRT